MHAHQLEQDVQHRQHQDQRRQVVHKSAHQIHTYGEVDENSPRSGLTPARRSYGQNSKEPRAYEDLGEQAQSHQDDEHIPRQLGHHLTGRADPEQRHGQARKSRATDHDKHPQAGQHGLREQRDQKESCKKKLRLAHVITVKSLRGTSTSQRG